MEKQQIDDFAIVLMRFRGRTLRNIARQYGVTTQRIQQRFARAIRRLLHAQSKWHAAEVRIIELQNAIIRLRAGFSCGSDLSANPVEVLDLSVRAYNILHNYGITSLYRLCQLTPKQVLQFKNCGKRTLDELRAELNRIEVKHNLGCENMDKL